MLPRVVITLVLLLSACSCQAQTINQKIVKFLESKRGIRVGGGECAHAASEALRVSGGEFIRSDLGDDTPSNGDYVWGTLLKLISNMDDEWKDSSPAAKVLPGDILQYGDAKLVIGNSMWMTNHHTAIAAVVSTEGMPTSVYQQNVNGVRTLEKDSTDLTKLVAGWVRIYRPKPRVDKPGQFKLTVVNNSSSEQAVTMKFKTQSVKPLRLTPADTGSSYSMELLTSSSPTALFNLELSPESFIPVENGSGYEVYVRKDEKVGIRKLSP